MAPSSNQASFFIDNPQPFFRLLSAIQEPYLPLLLDLCKKLGLPFPQCQREPQGNDGGFQWEAALVLHHFP
jgi:hypothetical protein